jgi:hypothetical protein
MRRYVHCRQISVSVNKQHVSILALALQQLLVYKSKALRPDAHLSSPVDVATLRPATVHISVTAVNLGWL